MINPAKFLKLRENHLSDDNGFACGDNGETFRSVWLRRHHGLISLFDMINPYGLQAFKVIGDMRELCEIMPKKAIRPVRGGFEPIIVKPGEFELTDRIREVLDSTSALCIDLDIKHLLYKILIISEMIYLDQETDFNYISDEIYSIYCGLISEFRFRKFLFVPLERERYYEQRCLFGEDVANKFPSASKDIESAGTCLALGQSTASVFHCMRVLEIGLDAFADSLSIPKQKNWGKYIEEVNKVLGNLDDLLPHLSAAKKRTDHAKRKHEDRKEYISNIIIHLNAVRIAWRNKTMHVDRDYDLEDAKKILDCVRDLMQEISERCKERHRRR